MDRDYDDETDSDFDPSDYDSDTEEDDDELSEMDQVIQEDDDVDPDEVLRRLQNAKFLDDVDEEKCKTALKFSAVWEDSVQKCRQLSEIERKQRKEASTLQFERRMCEEAGGTWDPDGIDVDFRNGKRTKGKCILPDDGVDDDDEVLVFTGSGEEAMKAVGCKWNQRYERPTYKEKYLKDQYGNPSNDPRDKIQVQLTSERCVDLEGEELAAAQFEHCARKKNKVWSDEEGKCVKDEAKVKREKKAKCEANPDKMWDEDKERCVKDKAKAKQEKLAQKKAECDANPDKMWDEDKKRCVKDKAKAKQKKLDEKKAKCEANPDKRWDEGKERCVKNKDMAKQKKLDKKKAECDANPDKIWDEDKGRCVKRGQGAKASGKRSGKTIKELKQLLKNRGLPVSGSKAELIKRLDSPSDSDSDSSGGGSSGSESPSSSTPSPQRQTKKQLLELIDAYGFDIEEARGKTKKDLQEFLDIYEKNYENYLDSGGGSDSDSGGSSSTNYSSSDDEASKPSRKRTRSKSGSGETVQEMKQRLKKLGLKVSGTKAELAERLEAYLLSNPWVEDEDSRDLRMITGVGRKKPDSSGSDSDSGSSSGSGSSGSGSSSGSSSSGSVGKTGPRIVRRKKTRKQLDEEWRKADYLFDDEEDEVVPKRRRRKLISSREKQQRRLDGFRLRKKSSSGSSKGTGLQKFNNWRNKPAQKDAKLYDTRDRNGSTYQKIKGIGGTTWKCVDGACSAKGKAKAPSPRNRLLGTFDRGSISSEDEARAAGRLIDLDKDPYKPPSSRNRLLGTFGRGSISSEDEARAAGRLINL